MKNIIIALIALVVFGPSAIAAPQKQKVYSIVKQYQEPAWYREQLKLWEADVQQNPKDANAWLNVYSATRMLKIMQGGKTQKDMDAVVEQVKKNIPETFEGNYIQYWNGNNEEHLVKYLDQAYQIDPNRPETYDDYVTRYEVSRDKAREKEFCNRWFNSNDMSEGLYAWSYNMLMSCDKNGILITQGDNDTYPGLVLQYARGIRTDVMILNAHLLMKPEYRNAILKELGLPTYTATFTDAEKLQQDICDHIRKNSKRPFYYASSVNPALYDSVKDNIYCTGLAFKYSATNFDNMAVLRKNYEKNFLKDYLKLNLKNDISQGVIDNMNSNYLTPFLLLHTHYTTTGETTAVADITVLIKEIAARIGQADEVEKILKESK